MLITASDNPSSPQPGPPLAAPVNDDEIEAGWSLLDVLTSFLCMLVNCSGEPWRPGSSMETLSQTVTKRMHAQMSSFSAYGVDLGLTAPEKTAGIADAEATRDHILASPGLLDPTLEADYLDMLEDMIDDLSS